MNLSQMFLDEFNREAKTTRRFLERIPNDKLNWQPHEKSMSAGKLGLHIAASQKGIMEMALADTFDSNNMKPQDTLPSNTQEILAAQDASVQFVNEKLPTITDEQMMQPWRAVRGDEVVFEMPRIGVIRNILMNHIYHHRGQLGVYLRLMGCRVPTAYGPSGDENMDGSPIEEAATTS